MADENKQLKGFISPFWAIASLFSIGGVFVFLTVFIIALIQTTTTNEEIIRTQERCGEARMGVQMIRSDSGRIIDVQCDPSVDYRL